MWRKNNINLFMGLNNSFTVIIRPLLTTCHHNTLTQKKVCAHAGCEVLFLPPGAIRAPLAAPIVCPVVVVYSAADNYRYLHVNLRMLVSVSVVVVLSDPSHLICGLSGPPAGMRWGCLSVSTWTHGNGNNNSSAWCERRAKEPHPKVKQVSGLAQNLG